MLIRLRSKIESKRYSPSIHWKLLVGMKDLLFISITKVGLARMLQLQPKKISYADWIKKYEHIPGAPMSIERQTSILHDKPLISIVVPVYEGNVSYLQEALDSVVQQTYTHWELCIVAGGVSKKTKKVLERYRKINRRIHVLYREKNEGIASHTQYAIAQARGTFVGFLDADDELAPHALYEVVRIINTHSDADIIYSDEDKIDTKGMRNSPFFKPDWSPFLLLSQNYINHFLVVRKSCIDRCGGIRTGFEGSQDYDLLLRLTEKTNAIYHISKILYHWRTHSGGMSSKQKDVCVHNALKALAEAFQRRSIGIDSIEVTPVGSYYLPRYSLVSYPLISIIIPTTGNPKLILPCIQSIRSKTLYTNYEIIIVDNNSSLRNTTDTYARIQGDDTRILRYDKPFNYSAINNFAVPYARGSYIVFLNDDTEVYDPEWLSGMLELCQHSQVGAVGAKLMYPDGKIQHAGVVLGIGGSGFKIAGHSHVLYPAKDPGYFGFLEIIREVSGVTGACLMMKKSLFEELGGFEEKIPVAFNDVDLCIRIRQAGYTILYTPKAFLVHHESVSRGPDVLRGEQHKSELLYMETTWSHVLQNDPFYNENLDSHIARYQLKQ